MCRLFYLFEEKMGSWISLEVKHLGINWVYIYIKFQYCYIKKVDNYERDLALCLALPSYITPCFLNVFSTFHCDKKNFKIISWTTFQVAALCSLKIYLLPMLRFPRGSTQSHDVFPFFRRVQSQIILEASIKSGSKSGGRE